VESVAWAAERRDVLCGFFYLLSLWFYLDFAAQSASRWWKYGTSLGFCVLALLSKPMAVSLPLVLLLLDAWPLGRLQFNPRKTILEKIPFLMVALATSWVTVVLQNRVGVIPSFNQLPMSYRLMNACHSVLFYLGKMVAPVQLAAHYPIMVEDTNSTGYAVSAFLIILISVFGFFLRKKRPYYLVAWLYFGITLGPVLGFIQVGYQAAGDRFTYLPSLGPFMLFSALLSGLLSKRPRFLILLAVIGSALLGYGTYRQVGIWKNSITLLENVLRVNPGKTMLVIDNNLGAAYEEAGRLDEALAEFDRVLYLQIRVPNPYFERGKIFLKKGRLDDAVLELRKAIVLSRFNPSFHDELGLVFLKMGMPPAALDEAQEALRSNPKHAMTQDTLGLVDMSLGRFDEAIKAFKEAHDLDPGNDSYFNHLIGAYRKVGNYRECLALYQELSKD
jgi:tetratricopeptide (TPR) repeat protein